MQLNECMSHPPPFPSEAVRLALQAVIQWAMWEPPGEAVRGELEVEFVPTERTDTAEAPRE